MRKLVLYIFLFTSPLLLSAQDSLGFTNKAEAKNVYKDSLKEGKWLEYLDYKEEESGYAFIKSSDTNADYYSLTFYKSSRPFGIKRIYQKNGTLFSEIPFVKGKKNGVEKQYYDNGNVFSEVPCVDDTLNGVERTYYESGKLESEFSSYVSKRYYENGQLESETPFVNYLANGTAKWYYTDGKKRRIYHFKNNEAVKTTYYDENGAKIKVPYFISNWNSYWVIKNNMDSSEILNLDTLKLTIYDQDKKNSNLWLSTDSCLFEFTTLDKSGSQKAIWWGKWKFSKCSHTLKLYIKDRNDIILNYSIRDTDSLNIVLIKKKHKDGKEIKK